MDGVEQYRPGLTKKVVQGHQIISTWQNLDISQPVINLQIMMDSPDETLLELLRPNISRDFNRIPQIRFCRGRIFSFEGQVLSRRHRLLEDLIGIGLIRIEAERYEDYSGVGSSPDQEGLIDDYESEHESESESEDGYLDGNNLEEFLQHFDLCFCNKDHGITIGLACPSTPEQVLYAVYIMEQCYRFNADTVPHNALENWFHQNLGRISLSKSREERRMHHSFEIPCTVTTIALENNSFIEFSIRDKRTQNMPLPTLDYATFEQYFLESSHDHKLDCNHLDGIFLRTNSAKMWISFYGICSYANCPIDPCTICENRLIQFTETAQKRRAMLYLFLTQVAPRL